MLCNSTSCFAGQSVGWLVGQLVGWSPFFPFLVFWSFLSFLNLLLLPKCSSDLLQYCSCPPICDWGSCVSSLIYDNSPLLNSRIYPVLSIPLYRGPDAVPFLPHVCCILNINARQQHSTYLHHQIDNRVYPSAHKC